MAKLKGPLFSLAARGSLAETLTYFPWKNIQVVRQHVVPANPQTTDQQAQRALMTAAVLEWHNASYTADDRTAWNRFAGTLAKVMSGFNAFCRSHINEGILTNTWTRLRNVTTDTIGAAGFDAIVVKTSAGDAPSVHYGTSRTFFPDTLALADQGGNVWAVHCPNLSASTLYYFYLDIGASADDYGRTGIYQQRTTA